MSRSFARHCNSFEHSSEDDPEYWKTLLLQLSYLWLDRSEFLGDEISKITIPSLVVVGDRDEFLPIEENVAMLRKIPNVEFCELPNTAHSIVSIRSAELFSIIVINFIKRNLE